MAWTFQSSSCTREAGQLVAVLDTILVAAGWSIQASVGNIRRYIPGAASDIYGQFALVVDDSQTDYAAGYGVRDGVGYSGSTLLPNVGTDPTLYSCSRSFAGADNLRIHKGTINSPGPGGAIHLYADESTCILLMAKTVSSIFWSNYYFGEFFSYTPSDTFKACIFGCTGTPQQLGTASYLCRGPAVTSAGSATVTTGGLLCAQHGYGGGLPYTSSNGCQFALGTSQKRVDTGLANSNTTFGGNGTANYIGGPYRFPNPVDNSMVVSPVHITQSTETTARRGVRGRLRGWYIPEHGFQYWSPVDGDTFSGSGDLAGKSFSLYRMNTNATAGSSVSFLAVETTNTVEKSA